MSDEDVCGVDCDDDCKYRKATLEDIFGAPILVYTRAQAIEDGVLVDLTAQFPDLCKQAGMRYPVACTAEVFADCIALTDAAKRACNDVTGRAWDVLYMLAKAAQRSRGESAITYQLLVVRDKVRPTTTTLKAVCGPIGPEDTAPCVTIMWPDQD